MNNDSKHMDDERSVPSWNNLTDFRLNSTKNLHEYMVFLLVVYTLVYNPVFTLLIGSYS